MARTSETSNSTPRDTPPILPKQFHQLMTKYSNILANGWHSHPKQHDRNRLQFPNVLYSQQLLLSNENQTGSRLCNLHSIMLSFPLSAQWQQQSLYYLSYLRYLNKIISQRQKPSMDGEEAHNIPPLHEELLATGCLLREGQLVFFKDAEPSQTVHAPVNGFSTHLHIASTNWTQ